MEVPSGGGVGASASASASAQQLRSCMVCRQRKIKCDRQQPCSNCIRSGCGCTYPSGRGRAPKRSRQTLDAQLADKLSRLETIVKRLASENATQAAARSTHQDTTTDDQGSDAAQDKADVDLSEEARRHADPEDEAVDEESPDSSSIDAQLGRLMIGDKKSYYLSNPLWASLADEIDEMREIIVKPEDEEDAPGSWPDVAPSNTGVNAALFGYRAVAHSLQSYHPPLPQGLDLFSAFTENVAPLIPLFHMPTLSATYRDAIASPESLDKNTEAVVFAIYYSSVVSLPPDQCNLIVGTTRDAAIERYRFAVEQAIARADLLNTQSMVLLQAVVLFISAFRSHDDSRASWSLTTLVFHLAQTMGLHRDGTVFGLKPFDVEMRRRLWWHICVLDSRSSDYHGFGPIMYQSTFDTRPPLNINDADLSPEMTEPPPERDGGTEMTFLLLRCETIKAAIKVRLVSPDLPKQPSRTGGMPEISRTDRFKMVDELGAMLRQRYIPFCDSTSPILLLSGLIARLVIAHFSLMIHYPMRRADESSRASAADKSNTGSPSPGAPKSQPSPARSHPDRGSEGRDVMTRDELFRTSTEILEWSAQCFSLPMLVKYAWYSKSHVHWHIAAFVLSEMCRRPPSADCERAWAAVTTMYDAWTRNMHSLSTQGLMLKSVRRLMARTKAVRDRQARGDAAGDQGTAAAIQQTPDLGWASDYAASANDMKPYAARLTATPGTVGSALGPDLTDEFTFQPGLFGPDLNDPFMELLDMSADLPMGGVSMTMPPFAAESSTSNYAAPSMASDTFTQGTVWTPWN